MNRDGDVRGNVTYQSLSDLIAKAETKRSLIKLKKDAQDIAATTCNGFVSFDDENLVDLAGKGATISTSGTTIVVERPDAARGKYSLGLNYGATFNLEIPSTTWTEGSVCFTAK